jgi:HEAT repeat protein
MKTKYKKNKEETLTILKTDNIKKKLKVLDKMNGVHKTESIRILLNILEDTSWTMREKAAYKLAHYGSRVVLRLEKLLRRGYWYTRASTCLALGEIGNVRVVPSIVMLLLTDENPTVIKEAAQALVKMARKNPEEFSRRIRALALDEPKVLKILSLLEPYDTELYALIKNSFCND